jgi:hypothetical protein
MRNARIHAVALVLVASFAAALARESTADPVQGTTVNAAATSSTTIQLNFATYPTEQVVQWTVCWKAGRLNPLPACGSDEQQVYVPGNNGTSGQYTIHGLRSDRWYTVKVRAQYKKANGGTQVFSRFVGKAQVKTP